MKMYNLTCYYPHKHLPRGWMIESRMEGATIAELPDIVLFTGFMFAILCFYNKCRSLFTGFLIKELDNLTEKIKNLVEKIWIKVSWHSCMLVIDTISMQPTDNISHKGKGISEEDKRVVAKKLQMQM
ncbi:uncharacterized protein LOC135149717 isoform X2 [Daucus carota subsp. sativus]|uniref:uncharacterized protein LOC135149717 isoform X2 n=1 Tax=Daucus carota subsp. sativus TaxID=79200 RepID=UPI003083E940